MPVARWLMIRVSLVDLTLLDLSSHSHTITDSDKTLWEFEASQVLLI